LSQRPTICRKSKKCRKASKAQNLFKNSKDGRMVLKMLKLTPYIHSEDARAQAGFYIQVLGGEINSVTTFGSIPGTPEENKDKVMHMQVVVGGNELFFSDSVFGPVQLGRSISLSVAYDKHADAREAFNKLSEGGQVKFPFDVQAWGGSYGEIQDKYGLNWMIVIPA
jgi:PhnB protein